MPAIGVSVLALLSERPMHPYEMYQTLRERHEDVVMAVSVGSLYHAVSRLAEHGHVRPLTTEQVGNRPERTTYEILDSGRDIMRARLYELLSAPTQLSQADHTGIGELHNLIPDSVLSAIDARVASLDDQIAEHEALLAVAQTRNVAPIYLLYGSYATSQQHQEREWFATLRDRIQTGDLTWPTPT
jgi:DNA-binding PadR family transcriptional regulator